MPRRLLTILAAVYVVAAAIGFASSGLEASADRIADARVWTLLTSALQPDGPWPLAQIALLAVLSAAVIVRFGPVTWWASALAGHVGSALIAYAAIGIADALGVASADRAGGQPDFGVSCVVGGSVGALLGAGYASGDRRATAVGLAGLVISVPFSLGWYDVEHVLSVLLGAAAAWSITSRRRDARDRRV